MNMKKIKVFFIILSFIILLTGGRVLWLDIFHSSEPTYAVNGLLDLREWDLNADQTISLDGEWEFYPNAHIITEKDVRELAALTRIPGYWNELLNPDEPTPYGYGSYRLRILLPPHEDQTFSIYVQSVRNSSHLFVNGLLLGSSGRPASNIDDYSAENKPYMASFRTDGNETVEVVIQAANYSDQRNGGLIRSLKFGTEEVIYKEQQLSMAMQWIIAAALLLQSIYLLVIFLINRNKSWFYLAVLLISCTVIILNSSEDKLLMLWLPISYDMSFKLLNFCLIAIVFSLLQLRSIQFPSAWRNRILHFYTVLSVSAALFTAILPTQHQITVQISFIAAALPIICYLLYTGIRLSVQGLRDNLLLVLAVLALINHFLWWAIHIWFTGAKLIYYPFDLLMGLVLLSSIGFKRYFEMYASQNELTQKLQEVNRRKDEFLANTSHELRNPLHGILNMSHVVLEREKKRLSRVSVSDLETVLAVGRRMSLMLDDLLDVSRLKDNNLKLNVQSVSIQSLANGVIDMVRLMSSGKPIVIRNCIPNDYPAVQADENRLIQILFNLLHNAVKYTHEGEIRLEGTIANGYATIAISDTGIGIDEEDLTRVFQPYEQASAERNHDEGGFGLGLSICKQLLELQGGTITVQSTRHQGSTFTFTLPLALSNEVTVPEQERLEHGQIAVASQLIDVEERVHEHDRHIVKDRPRILAVDDDAVNLRILESILSANDYSLTTVTSGQEALALADDQEWDLVITDVMMPGMSGFELTRRLRKRHEISDLPILLLTARSRLEDIELGFLAGANDYTIKPVDARELRSRVKALTQLRRSMRERIRMEAAWLQAQIEPHFFLNTLNSIAALHVIHPERMIELIEHFGEYLTGKFKFHAAGEGVSLKDELTLVRSYLYIEQVRYGERLRVEWMFDEDDEQLMMMQVPPYSIQPLVENAVRHGIMKRIAGGTVHIKIEKLDGGAEITVEDDGVGIEEHVIQRLRHGHEGAGDTGIGLRNVDMRLRRISGEGLKIESRDSCTSVSFVIRTTC